MTRPIQIIVAAAPILLSAACMTTTKEPEKSPSGALALIITTDYESGAYSTIRRTDRTVYADIEAIHADAVCRYDRNIGAPFIVNRWGADAIAILDPNAEWRITREYSVAAGSNPQDIAAVSPERAYVARLNEPALLAVHPFTGAHLQEVDLSEYADDDGIPDVTWLLALDGKVYALLARLDAFRPTDHSTLLVIDGPTGAVEEELRLTHTNPSGKLRYQKDLEKLVLIETGGFSSLGGADRLDGIVELFDPATRTLSGPVVTAEALGGDIIDAVILSSTKGFAIIEQGSDDTLATHLVTFDPGTGKKGRHLSSQSGFAYSALELTPDGKELWLADRTRTNPGIRIFDATTDALLTPEPIDVGMPPFMICFIEDADTEIVPGTGGDGGAPADGGREYPLDAGSKAPALFMEETTGQETPLSASACPVPQAPVLTVIPAGTTISWTVPEQPDAALQIGWSEDLEADAPADWVDGATFTFEDRDAPYAVRLFARFIGDGCVEERWFSHVYNVRESFPPAPDNEGSTAIHMSDAAFQGWADGIAGPVTYGEEVLEKWRTPERALGPAQGTSGDILCLGRGGEVTLTFDPRIEDRAGFDFALFENASNEGFLDLAAVSVSSDGDAFASFDTAYLGAAPLGPFDTHDTALIGQIAGKYPAGWGQPFDLHALSNKPEVVSGRVDLLSIRFVKIVDIPGDGSVTDSFGHPILDPYPCVDSAGFDLDAVGVLR